MFTAGIGHSGGCWKHRLGLVMLTVAPDDYQDRRLGRGWNAIIIIDGDDGTARKPPDQWRLFELRIFSITSSTKALFLLSSVYQMPSTNIWSRPVDFNLLPTQPTKPKPLEICTHLRRQQYCQSKLESQRSPCPEHEQTGCAPRTTQPHKVR